MNRSGPSRISRVLAVAALLAAAGCFASARAAQGASDSGKVSNAGFSFRVAPTPAWVVPAREAADAAVEPAPMHYRIVDDQVLLDGTDRWFHSHVVRVVDQPGGLGVASQIEIEFDPSFQTLLLHHIDIVRNGRHIRQLDPKRVQLLQRETQLERRMYDGRVTASIVLGDVRVGDQIDLDYSIRGANPVFDGRFADVVWMTSPKGPIAAFQYRLVAPRTREIAFRGGSKDITVESRIAGANRETVFRRQSIPQLHLEPGAPYAATLGEQLQLSEYRDWADVAGWGRNLFVEADTSAASLDEEANVIRAQTTDPGERLLQALQFVQVEVRYFGTEIGASSHRPAAPEKVLAQRFGDCKDKVLLLVALLRRLGITATPVLVSTRLRAGLGELLPSPLAFDHVIARVELDGKTWWLDATRDHQTGGLAGRQSIGLGRGLPLAADVAALAELPTAFDQQRMVVEDTFRIVRFTEDATLESRITYRGDLAEILRDAMAAQNIDAIKTQIDEPYVRLYPKLRSSAPLKVEDARDDDALTVVQQFVVPEFWRFPEQQALVADLGYWSLVDILRYPGEQSRHQVYAFAYPGVFSHRVVIEYPEDVFAEPSTQHFEDGDSHFAFRTTVEATPQRVQYQAELQVLVDAVEPADWNAYTARVLKLSPRLGFVTAVSAIPLDQRDALNKELKAADAGLRAGKIKAITRLQKDALGRAIFLSQAIDGGRLPPALAAQALTARGVADDTLGRLDAGRADFDAALKLVPDAQESLTSASVNAMARGDYAGSLELTARVLAAHPADSETRFTRARDLFLSRDYPSARTELVELLKDRGSIRRGYPLLFLYLTARSLGTDGKAALEPYQAADLPLDWPRPLIELMLGNTSEEAVLQAAKAAPSAGERLCEAYFYLGERELADGHERSAREHFEQGMAQGITEYSEDSMARNELARLQQH